jgi:hypothetical protein
MPAKLKRSFIAFLLCTWLLLLIGPLSSWCQDTNKTTTDTIGPKSREIPGEFIITFTNADTDAPIAFILSSLKGQNLVNESTKEKASGYLKAIFPYLKNLNRNDVKYIGPKNMVLHLDSAAYRQIKTDPHFKSVKPNIMVLRPYGVDFKPYQSPPDGEKPHQVVGWGVRSVVRSIRQDIQLRNKVWVIDSGIDKDHEDINVDKNLSRSLIDNVPYFKVDGYMDGHGTHVAGIIGAKNNDVGIVGVAPGITIVALKVVQDGILPDYNAYLRALDVVFDEGQPGDVVNISIQNTPGYQEEIDDIIKIGQKGIFVVLAAGNDHVDINSSAVYPAVIAGKNIYSVSSCDSLDKFSVFSNFGQLSLAYIAPGAHIYSCLPGNSYGFADGTSMAAPHAAGLLALLRAISTGSKILCPYDHKMYALAHE